MVSSIVSTETGVSERAAVRPNGNLGAKVGTSKEATAWRKAKFVERYITNGGNATQAAIDVGYAASSAHVRGAELVRDSKVKAAIAARAKEVANKYELTTDLAARSIVQELTFDPAKLYDENGRLKSVKDLDEDTRMALASLEFEQIGSLEAPIYVRKVKWASRSAAREQLMKHLGMFEKDNAQKQPVILNLNLAGKNRED